jgi:hypothetical protein
MEWIVEGLKQMRLEKASKDTKGAPYIRERLSVSKRELSVYLPDLVGLGAL